MSDYTFLAYGYTYVTESRMFAMLSRDVNNYAFSLPVAELPKLHFKELESQFSILTIYKHASFLLHRICTRVFRRAGGEMSFFWQIFKF